MKRTIISALCMAILLALLSTPIMQMQTASALTISSVDVSPSEIAPGQAADIQITLKNNFDRDLNDVEISLDLSSEALPFAPYDSSIEGSIEEIADGKSKEFGFRIIALDSAKPGIYKIPVGIRYVDNNTRIEKSSLISLIVSSLPSIEVTTESSVLIKGESNALNVRIINNGLSDIKLLRIKINEAIGIRIVSPTDAYIGELSSDNFDSAEFRIFIESNAPSTSSLPVELTYKDIKNNDVKETRNIALKIYSRDEAVSLGLVKRSNTFIVVLVVIILVILFIFYRVLRKRVRKRQSRQI